LLFFKKSGGLSARRDAQIIDDRSVIESLALARKRLSAVAAAAAARPDVVSARAGMQGGVGVIPPAAAIGSPMPAWAATAGNLDDFDSRRLDRLQRQRIGDTGACNGAEKKCGCDEFFHGSYPVNELQQLHRFG
jgi:hypothetical protein